MMNFLTHMKVKTRESKKHPEKHFRITMTTRSKAGKKDKRTYLVAEVELNEALQEAGYRIIPGTRLPRTTR